MSRTPARAVVAVLAAVVALGAGGCSPEVRSSQPDADSLVVALNTSLGRHDRGAFLASFAATAHAQATGALWYDNLVQFASVTFSAPTTDRLVVDAALPGEEEPGRHRLLPSLAVADGSTVITAVRALQPAPIWGLEPIAVQPARGGTVLIARRAPETVRAEWRHRLEAAAESVHEARLGPLDDAWGGRLVIEVPGDALTFRSVTGTPPHLAAALTLREGSAYRIVVNPDLADSRDEAFLDAVTAHEATHVAARTMEAAGSPGWAVEGLAESVAASAHAAAAKENRRLVIQFLAHHPAPGRLPTDAELEDEQEALTAYALAQVAVDAVLDRLGHDAGMRLLEGLVHHPTGIGEAELDQITRWYVSALRDLDGSA